MINNTNNEFHGPVDYRKALALHLFMLDVRNQSIPTVRVSSAQARGAAKRYAYWGAVRYEIRLSKRGGCPINVACERASSDRCSERGAERDADKIADREGRIFVYEIGLLSRACCARVLQELGAEAQAQDTIAA